MTYHATSLGQIADELERLSDEHAQIGKTALTEARQNYELGQAVAYREAAALVRATTLEDQEKRALREALEDMTELFEMDPEASEPGTDVYAAIAVAKALLSARKDAPHA